VAAELATASLADRIALLTEVIGMHAAQLEAGAFITVRRGATAGSQAWTITVAGLNPDVDLKALKDLIPGPALQLGIFTENCSFMPRGRYSIDYCDRSHEPKTMSRQLHESLNL